MQRHISVIALINLFLTHRAELCRAAGRGGRLRPGDLLLPGRRRRCLLRLWLPSTFACRSGVQLRSILIQEMKVSRHGGDRLLV